MSNFFDESRQTAGFHVLIFLINVFDKPHKPARGERSSSEKEPFQDGN